MPLELIHLNSPPVVAVNCDNRKVLGERKVAQKEVSKINKKMITLSLERKK